jgi:MEMO1 family protein
MVRGATRSQGVSGRAILRVCPSAGRNRPSVLTAILYGAGSDELATYPDYNFSVTQQPRTRCPTPERGLGGTIHVTVSQPRGRRSLLSGRSPRELKRWWTVIWPRPVCRTRAAEGPDRARMPAMSIPARSPPVPMPPWRRRARAITRVVLLGPAHRVPVRGLAASSADRSTRRSARSIWTARRSTSALTLPQVRLMDEAHAQEHSLEVQLPFLQEVLDRFTPGALRGRRRPPGRGRRGARSALGRSRDPDRHQLGPQPLSRLRHRPTIDTATSAAIEALRPQDIGYDQACGRIPVNGLLELARRRGMQARTLDLRNSGDTAGPRDQVVGYGAYVFH